jgi:hypothetical protein
MANSRLHLILEERAVIVAIGCRINWHTMVKHKYTLAEEHDVHDFQSSVTFVHTIQHSVVSAELQMNAPMTHQPLQYNRGTHCLHFSNVTDGTWQEEHARFFGYH